MTRGEFLLELKDEIRGTCALHYSIPDKEINRIIDQAKKYFYRNYKESVESQHYVVPMEEFKKQAFKSQRSIEMPKCVVSVTECKEISGGGRLFTIDADFSDNRLIAAELYLSPFQSDDLVMRTAQYAYWDLAQAFFLDRVAYDFNRNTSKLKIRGRNPKKNLYLMTYVEIPEEDLFEDWFFIRYCTAKVKVALGRILGFFEYQLPGGVSINSGDIKAEGESEIEELLTKIDDENSPDWFFVWH